MRVRKGDGRCGKDGRNETPGADAIGGRRFRSRGTSGRKIMIALPVAKKVPDSTVLPKLLDEHRYVVLKVRLEKSTNLLLALIHRCLVGAEEGPTFGELGQILVDVLRHGPRVRPGRKGLKRGGTIVQIHAVLLDALSCSKTLTLLKGRHLIAILQ